VTQPLSLTILVLLAEMSHYSYFGREYTISASASKFNLGSEQYDSPSILLG
jgi:hypothetical protein